MHVKFIWWKRFFFLAKIYLWVEVQFEMTTISMPAAVDAKPSMDQTDVDYNFQSFELLWLKIVEVLIHWRHRCSHFVGCCVWGKFKQRVNLLEWVSRRRDTVGGVRVFQLLQVHLPVRLLDRLVHFRLAHNLPHEILDGWLGVQLQQLRHAAVFIVEGLRWRRWSDFVRTLPAAPGEGVAERSLSFCVDLIAVELLVASRVLRGREKLSVIRGVSH